MKAIDSSDLFKYSPNKQKRETVQEPYLQRNIILYKYNHQTGTNVNQGNFVLQLSPSPNGVKFIVRMTGAIPIIDMILTKNVNWQIRETTGYFTDSTNTQWTVQFNDAESAALATAQIGLLLTCNSTKTVSFYEPQQAADNPPVSLEDTIKMSYFAFSIQQFPRIGKIFASDGNTKAVLSPQVLAQGLAQGIVGMIPSHTRTIFIPQNMLQTQTGYRDEAFPNTPAVFVVTITNVKYKDEKKAPKPAPVQHQTRQKSTSPAPQQIKQQQQVQQQEVEKPKPAPVQVEEKKVEEPKKEVQAPEEKVAEPKKEESDATTDASDENKKSNPPTENDESQTTDDASSAAKEKSDTTTDAEPPAEEEPETNSVAAKIAKFKKIGIMSPLGSMGVPFNIAKKKKQEEEERRKREEEESAKDATDESTTTTTEKTPEKKVAAEVKEVKTPEKSETKTPEKKEVKTPEKKEAKTPEKKEVEPKTPSHDIIDSGNSELFSTVEENITKKINNLTHAKVDNPDDIARGVATMVAQLKVADSTIATLNKQIEEKKQKMNSSGILQKQLLSAQNETEALKRKVAQDESSLKEIEAKIQALTIANKAKKAKKQPPNGEKAKEKASQVIKKLMQSVFEQMNNEFDEGEAYNGQAVIDALFKLLQKQAYNAMDAVEKEGLL